MLLVSNDLLFQIMSWVTQMLPELCHAKSELQIITAVEISYKHSHQID